MRCISFVSKLNNLIKFIIENSRCILFVIYFKSLKRYKLLSLTRILVKTKTELKE